MVEDGGVLSQFKFVADDTLNQVIALNDSCQQFFQDFLTSALSDKHEDPIACLIRDTHWYNLEYIVNKLKVPTLVLNVTGAAYVNCFIMFPRLRKA